MPARLTIDQFIAELREKTEREGTEWELAPFSGRLRTSDGLCPLQFWTATVGGYLPAARKRGMSDDDIDSVIGGADYRSSCRPKVVKVRAQLLAATGAA